VIVLSLYEPERVWPRRLLNYSQTDRKPRHTPTSSLLFVKVLFTASQIQTLRQSVPFCIKTSSTYFVFVVIILLATLL
jgi:hypothetical protein